MIVGLLALALASGCRDDQDPEGARELWDRIHAEGYRGWERAPGYASRRETRAPHGDEVDIYVNDVLAGDLAMPEGTLRQWSFGAIVVKDGWSGSDACIVAALEKREDGWFYAEWDPDGESLWSGRPDLCVGCHVYGEDEIRAFGLP